MQVSGVMAALDVLGWQAGKSERSPAWRNVTEGNTLAIVDTLRDRKQFAGINCIAGVFETDSYIIAAWRDNKEIDTWLIEFVAVSANAFISTCWHRALPLRGCLSIGDFAVSDDFVISGKALADARSEYSAMNWVGCHATTNASKFLDNFVPKYKILTDAFVGVIDPPYKDLSLLGNRWVLNWPFAYFKQTGMPQIREIMQKELGSAKKDKDKAKYELTIRFFEKVYAHLEDREKRRAAKRND